MKEVLYSIVVPVYKSTDSLVELSSRVDDVFKELEGKDYEIIFVNDSPFSLATVECLRKLVDLNHKVTVIELMKNFGQHPATMCGMKHAKGKFIVNMDDDLQHAPEDIPLLMEHEDNDVVIASFKLKKHGFFKRTASNMKGYFDHIILGKPKGLRLSPFRLMNANICSHMVSQKSPFPFIPAMFFGITQNVVNVELEHHKRFDGLSNYTIGKLISLFTNLLISNSSLLLRSIGYIGVSISGMSLLFGLVVVFRKIAFDSIIQGWSSIVLLVIFFGGLTLFSLGVIGEYLIRLIVTAEERPTYYVRSVNKK
jgi:glycosyltransferase involved in cell wall biosynthesis